MTMFINWRRLLGVPCVALLIMLSAAAVDVRATSLVALTNDLNVGGNVLMFFDVGDITAKPLDFRVTSKIIVTGLPPGVQLFDIDFRPATRQLYGLGSDARLYIIDTTSGSAQALGAPANLQGTAFGISFDPVADRLRVVSDANQNLQFDPTTGRVSSRDATPTYDASDTNTKRDPGITALAHTNSFAGASSTTTYAIDVNQDVLVTLGSLNGAPAAPSSGRLLTVGALGVDTSSLVAFDITPGNDIAFAAMLTISPHSIDSSQLYAINLSTGAATVLADVGANIIVRGLAVVPFASSVQFSSSGYTVAEDARSLVVTVTRTGNLSQTATADFGTNDTAPLVRCDAVTGIASPRCDYATSVSRVSFAAGQASATGRIFITDDAFIEGTETFTISLRSASGASLGAQHTASVSIVDNDATNTSVSNPIDQPDFFVRQQYVDFLSREPDAAGFEAWQNVLRRCPNTPNDAACDRVSVSAAFSRSDEYLFYKGYYALRFYRVLLFPSRVPSYQEFVGDVQFLTGATTDEVLARQAAFAEQFIQRPEFSQRYSFATNREFVRGVYARAVVQISETTLDQITAELDSTRKTRAQIIREVVESRPIFEREFNSGFVAAHYYGYLRREPEAVGFQAWVRVLERNPQDYRTVTNGFVNSEEYRLRFGQP